jgi:hypothetical protein
VPTNIMLFLSIQSKVKSSDSNGPLSKFISFPLLSCWIMMDSTASK